MFKTDEELKQSVQTWHLLSLDPRTGSRKNCFMEKKKAEGEPQVNIYILTPDDKANVTVGAAAPITTAAVMESQNR